MVHELGGSRLSIGITVAEALRFSWSNRWLFGRFMIIPAALDTLLNLVPIAFHEGSDSTASTLVWSFMSLIPGFLVLTWFAVACHRLILIGEGSVSRFGLTRWTWRETRFFLWMFLAYAIGYLFMLLCDAALFGVVFLIIVRVCGFSTNTMSLMMDHPAFFPGVMAFASIPFAYVVGRVSLLLPATAIDLRPSFSSAWELSTGNGWRVAILVGGVPIAFMAIQALVWMIPSWVLGENLHKIEAVIDGTSISLTFLESILRYIFATVEITILSISFRRLREIEESKLASPAAT